MHIHDTLFVIFRPPKFDFEAALEKHRARHKTKFLRQQKVLNAYVNQSLQKTKPSHSKGATEEIEEFRDGGSIPNDYYYDSSGDMTDEDYY